MFITTSTTVPSSKSSEGSRADEFECPFSVEAMLSSCWFCVVFALEFVVPLKSVAVTEACCLVRGVQSLSLVKELASKSTEK